MSISRPNVPNLLSTLVTAALSCACVAAPTTNPTKLTAAEAAKARVATLTALRTSVDEPADHVPNLRIAAAPVWSDATPSHRALVLASLSYPGAQYAYCRLVTLPADLAAAQVSDSSAMPDCRGVSRASFIDVNGDGLLDVVAGLRVPSNRYDITLEVPAVFLSDASAPGGYCYSQQASDHLQPDDLASGDRARTALTNEQTRLKLDRWACGRY